MGGGNQTETVGPYPRLDLQPRARPRVSCPEAAGVAISTNITEKPRLSAFARMMGRNPPKRLAGMLVAALTIYLIAHTALLYSKLDFGSAALGGSEVTDFFVFYSASHMLWQSGDAAGLYDPWALKDIQVALGAGATQLHPYNYPPSYDVFIMPLAALPYVAALIGWQWITLALFAGSLWVAGLRRMEILAGVVAPASALNVAAGQNGFLTSTLLVAGMALLARKEKVAGLLFGLLTVKPHLGLLIPIAALAGRRWQAIATAAATAAGLIGLSMVLWGAEVWPIYLNFLDWFVARAEAETGGSFLAFSASVLQACQIAGLPTAAGIGIQAAVSLAVGMAVYRAYRHPAAPDLRLALLLVGASLATPYGYVYDLPFAAAGIVLAARPGLRDGFLPYEGLSLLAAFLLPIAASGLSSAGVPLLPVAHLVVFGWILVRLSRSQETLRHPCGYTLQTADGAATQSHRPAP
jgi:hypothetical protein